MHARLTEGMRRYDLEDMVLPLISIDEYLSKVSNEAIVVGFYVADQNAAQDLNRFLQKTPIDILDTDISPAPDQRGYFLVFVEMLNNDMTAKNIMTISKDMENLTGITKWQMRLRGNQHILRLSAEPIIRHLATMRDTVKESQVLEFLAPSTLRSLHLVENALTLDNTPPLTLVDFGDIECMLCRHDLKTQTLGLDAYSRWHCDKIRHTLGEGWQVDKIGRFKMIHRGGDIALLVKD